jgi:hypothetical protein
LNKQKRPFLNALLVLMAVIACTVVPAVSADAATVTCGLYMEQERGLMAGDLSVSLSGSGGNFSTNFVGDSVNGEAVLTGVPNGTYTATFTDMSMNNIYTELYGDTISGFQSTSVTITVTSSGATCGAFYLYSDYGPPGS